MGEPELQPSSLIAHSASGDRIQLLGRQCTYSFHDASVQGKFYVANTSSNLLGAEWISKKGIYALMDSLPSTDPGQLIEINASIADQTSSNVGKQLQQDILKHRAMHSDSTSRLQQPFSSKPELNPFSVPRPIRSAAQPAVTNATFRRHFQTKPARTKKGRDPIKNPADVSLQLPTTTPNSGLEGSKLPAELCLGRKLRKDINTTMERQFNRHHGARRRTFKRGDPVLVNNYQGQQSWTNGQVLRRLGRVLYEVRVAKEAWIRHAYQLRMRFGEESHNRLNDMDTLFEIFDLEPSPHYGTTPQDNAVGSTSTTPAVQDVPQLRRSTRSTTIRRQPIPKKLPKHWNQLLICSFPEGGGVGYGL
ncbi:hypothetical protein Y032_0002g1028 [Ancylostoma ceylanicum]|uniref:Uncharacterized protein n=1 Tax=Ancylostoma ceylanicum TaxID=53326 RepID=A0A016VZB3_9BILA|nr:hypothetical protein Y032_0002g1028 [Ancylostoma ceylanicum]